MKKFSSYSNCDLGLSPIMLKHKIIQDVAIPKICMKLYQNQSINESIGLLTTSPRELKLEFDQDIFILNICVKLQLNQSINESARAITMFFYK